MNPLTLVKRIQNINAKEASLGISEEASWHAKYKDSAYVFVGGIPFDLTEGDLLAVFAQYGEIVDVNLVRDKGTGKSKGFAFVAYEDQRSTNLAVDNLNGAQILGRTIRVDHVGKYKKKEEEDEETEQKKREARGVCRAFQRGECTRGAGCKFSHDEQRAANTGWGDKDKEPRWGHDRFDGSKKDERRSGNIPSNRVSDRTVQEGDRILNSRDKANETSERDFKQSNRREEKRLGSHGDDHDLRTRDRDSREKSSRRHNGNDYQPKSSEYHDKLEEKRSRKHDDESMPKSREVLDRREEIRSARHGDDEVVPKGREDLDKREDKRSRRYNDNESEPRSREEQDRRSKRHNDDEIQPKLRGYQDKREGERTRRHVYDEIDPTRDRREEKRSSGHDNSQFEPRSRRDYERSR
ncbi:Splicing factor-like protein [Parasponia andersonii]|uniref:Splicing factor-like protein n=1 Tax=Parasponia andersonii TaxID=3476 RepID=A0A2P5CPN9_PARAD|nr:Splicing factor-like protein [Parasponia andersonii]